MVVRMSAFGPERKRSLAPHTSASDPKRTRAGMRCGWVNSATCGQRGILRIRRCGDPDQLVYFDGRELDDPCPFRCFIGDEFTEIGGRATKFYCSQISKPHFDCLISE